MNASSRVVNYIKTRQRLVQLRLADYADRMAAGIKGNGLRTYWYRDEKNFGDLLTPRILNNAGVTAVHADQSSAQIVAIGSLIQTLPQDFAGTILGTGLISDRFIPLPNAHIISVRGPLTRSALALDSNTPLGDLGLISDMLIRGESIARRFVLGIIPHYVDKHSAVIGRLRDHFGSDALVIDVQRDPEQVLRDIASCEHVLSSSLHGLICADALGVANGWMVLSSKIGGGEFKFRDYFGSIDEPERRPVDFDVPTRSALLRQLRTVPAAVTDLASKTRILATAALSNLLSEQGTHEAR